MFSKNLIAIIFTTVLFKNQVNAVCIPCPRPGLTIASFSECDCPLNQFYNELTRSCVSYIQCPLPPSRNPIPEIKALVPSLANQIDPLASENTALDLILMLKAVNKRIENIKKNIPSLLGPIVGTVAIKNKDLFDSCEGRIPCVIRGALKRESNYDLIFPKLKSVADAVIRNFYGIFDDLKDMAKESCRKSGDCPVIKRMLRFKDYFPGNFEELRDIVQIVMKVNKYFLKELKQ